jgi:hypothetical protein
MTNVQIAVGFWWEAGVHPPAKPAGAIVFINNFTDEICFGRGFFSHNNAPSLR